MAKKRTARDSVSFKASLMKYLAVAILLGLIEGAVTYLFLNEVSCSVASSPIGDPLTLIPYIILMVVVAIIALSLLIRGDRVSSSLFLSFMLVWLLIGFGAYYAIGPMVAC